MTCMDPLQDHLHKAFQIVHTNEKRLVVDDIFQIERAPLQNHVNRITCGEDLQ